MHGPRSQARLAAIQALYEMEQTGSSGRAASVALEHGHVGLDADGDPLPDPDRELFSTIVDAVVTDQGGIDATISRHLAKGWRLSRLGSVARAILRAAMAEKRRCPNRPVAVILDEYVSIAGIFLDSSETGFVNGLLSAGLAGTAAAMD